MKFEHLITIKDKAKPRKRVKKWPVEPAERSKLLARRKTGLINFYDCSMIVDDVEPLGFRQLNYQDIPATFTAAGSFDPVGFNTAIQSLIFAEGPIRSWKNIFKQITPDMDMFPLVVSRATFTSTEQVVFTAANWSAQGLKVAPSYWTSAGAVNPRMIISSTPFWYEVTTSNAGNNKVTLEYDPDADAVDILPTRKMDIFLIPRPNFVRARCVYFDNWLWPQPPSDPNEITHTEYLNYFWQVYPREWWLDDHPFSQAQGSDFPSAGDGMNITTNFDHPTGSTVYQPLWERFFTVKEYMKVLENHRSLHDFSDPFPTTTGDGDDFLVGFVLESYPWIFGAGGRVLGVFEFEMEQGVENLGQLRGVIRQSGRTYYVWRG